MLPEDTQSLIRAVSTALVNQDADPTDVPVAAVKARLISLCQHAVHVHAALALTQLAAYSWWHGDGALARVAIDRSLRCDPA